MKEKWIHCCLLLAVVLFLFLFVPVSFPMIFFLLQRDFLLMIGKPIDWLMIYNDGQTSGMKVAVDIWCAVADVITVSLVVCATYLTLKRKAPFGLQVFVWMLFISLIGAQSGTHGLWSHDVSIGIPFPFLRVVRFVRTPVFRIYFQHSYTIIFDVGVLSWEIDLDLIPAYLIWFLSALLLKKIHQRCFPERGEVEIENKEE